MFPDLNLLTLTQPLPPFVFCFTQSFTHPHMCMHALHAHRHTHARFFTPIFMNMHHKFTCIKHTHTQYPLQPSHPFIHNTPPPSPLMHTSSTLLPPPTFLISTKTTQHSLWAHIQKGICWWYRRWGDRSSPQHHLPPLHTWSSASSSGGVTRALDQALKHLQKYETPKYH